MLSFLIAPLTVSPPPPMQIQASAGCVRLVVVMLNSRAGHAFGDLDEVHCVCLCLCVCKWMSGCVSESVGQGVVLQTH